MQRPVCFKKVYYYAGCFMMFPFLVFNSVLLHTITTTTTRHLHDVVLPRGEKEALMMGRELPDAVPFPQQKSAMVPSSSSLPGEGSSLSKPGTDVANAAEKKAKNAYSFQIAPCDPDQKIAVYRHLLYSVYTAIYALKYKHGSQADFHVYIEMWIDSPHKRLPDEEERVFYELGDTYFHYIPPKRPQGFYRTQMQKFRILGLEQYSHVWHLDADVLPLTNLDYVFDLIDQGVLRKNVGFSEGRHEPVNGGSFIVSPRPGALKEINDIIYRREHTKWNDTVGWGHAITAPDRWLSDIKPGMHTWWDFYGGNTDQGLLFYWIKYVEKDVSIVLANGAIERWGPSPPGEDDNGRQPVKLLETTEKNALKELKEVLPKSVCMSHWQNRNIFQRQTIDCETPRPQRDYIHFNSWRKPWLTGLPEDYFNTETSPVETQGHYWFSLFDEINEKHHLGLNLTTFTPMVELNSAGRWTQGYLFPSGSNPSTYDLSVKNIPAEVLFTTLIDDSTRTCE